MAKRTNLPDRPSALNGSRQMVLYEICWTVYERRMERIRERDEEAYWGLKEAVGDYVEHELKFHIRNSLNVPFRYFCRGLNRLADHRGDNPVKTLNWLFDRYEKKGEKPETFIAPLKTTGDFARKHFRRAGYER